MEKLAVDEKVKRNGKKEVKLKEIETKMEDRRGIAHLKLPPPQFKYMLSRISTI